MGLDETADKIGAIVVLDESQYALARQIIADLMALLPPPPSKPGISVGDLRKAIAGVSDTALVMVQVDYTTDPERSGEWPASRLDLDPDAGEGELDTVVYLVA